MSAVRPETQVAIARIRDELAQLAATARGVELSERIPGSELFVFAASTGDAGPGDLVLCDAQGEPVPDTPGAEAWSSGARAHAALYDAHPAVGALVRTGSADAPRYTSGLDARTALDSARHASRAD